MHYQPLSTGATKSNLPSQQTHCGENHNGIRYAAYHANRADLHDQLVDLAFTQRLHISLARDAPLIFQAHNLANLLGGPAATPLNLRRRISRAIF